jgi:hypothetical protein
MPSKILFWINGALTTFCVANSLQKKIDDDFYAIVESYEKPKIFFQNQQFVKFQKTWFYHDNFKTLDKPNMDYLSNFEKKYNLNLWELAINERIFYRFNSIYTYSTDEILSILQRECEFFDQILAEIEPDFLIMYEPTMHQHELFYRMCKSKGIKILLLNQPNISRCIISETPRKIDGEIDLENIEYSKKTFEELRKYRDSFSSYKTIKNYRKNFKVSNFELIKSAFTFFLSENEHIKTHYTHRGRTKIKVLNDEIQKKLKRKFRYSFINNNLENKINFNEKFVYFPLAVDEERNLLINAPFYTNQVEVIRNIVKSLPIGYKLYVKENPAQVVRYWRNISEYKEILSIPNIRLIHPSFPAENLYTKCSLVISIGGTSGLDAAFYEKPSIIFSDLGYSVLPSVSRLKNIEDLSNLISESLQKKVCSEDLEKYLSILHKNSFDFNPMDFENKVNESFYFNGHYASVHISENKMKLFLEQNKSMIDVLAFEFEKKIKQLI